MARQYKTGLIITGDASGGIRAIQATDKELGQLNRGFERGGRQAKRFGSDADRAGRSLRGFSGETDTANRGLDVLRRTGVGVGTALAGAFAVQNVAGQARLIAETDALARTLGVATGELQAWQYAGQQVGLQADKISDIFKDVSDKIGDFAATGGGEAKDLFEQLNLKINELIQLAPDQQLLKIGEAISQVEDPSRRTFYLESLADEAVRLQPLLEDNARGLREYAAEARALGVAMDEEAIASAIEADRAMQQLSGSVTGLTNQLAADLGPGLAETAKNITNLVEAAGGAERILEGLANVGATLAALYGTRLVGSIAAKTHATLADAQADARAAQASTARAAEAMRVAQSEQAAAQRALANSRATAAATGNTTLRTRALTQLAAANQRAIAAEVAHTQAVNAQAAAMSRASVVARGFSGALALVGGPVGAAIIAAGAIYHFREELGLVRPELEANRDRVDQLTGSLENLTRATAQNRITQLTADLAELKTEFISITEIGGANDTQRLRGSGVLGVAAGEVGRQAQAIRDSVEGIAEGIYSPETQAEIKAFEAAIAGLEGHLESLGESGRRTGAAISDGSEAAKEAARAAEKLAQEYDQQAGSLVRQIALFGETGEAAKLRYEVEHGSLQALDPAKKAYLLQLAEELDALNAAQKAAEQYEKQVADLVKQYDQQRQKGQRLATDLTAINEAYRRGDIDGGQYQRMTASIRDEMQQLALEADPLAQEMARAWTEAANRIDETFADAFMGAFDSFDDFADQLLDGFKRLLAELAYQATLKPIVVRMTGQMQGMMGGGGQQGGMNAGGMGLDPTSLVSAGKTAYGYLTGAGASAGGGWATQVATTGSYSGWAGSATATGYGSAAGHGASLMNNQWATGAGSGMVNMGVGMGAGLAGNWAGQQVFGGGKTSNDLGQIGAAIGSIWGPIGTAVGAFIGQAAGSLFGDKYAGEDPTGILKTVNEHGASGRDGFEREAYADSALGRIGFARESRDIDTLFGDRDNFDNAKEFAAQLAAMDNTIATLARSEAELNTLREAAADQGLTSIGSVEERYRRILSSLGGVYGDYVETLKGGLEEIVAEAVSARHAFNLLTDGMERLNLRFREGSVASYRAAGHLAELMGGVESLASAQASYYQNFYSESERLSHLQEDLASAMGDMNLTLPTTADQFRDLVEAQNLMTRAGREQYAALLKLAPTMGEYLTAMERQRAQLNDWIDDLLLSEQSTLDPGERLQESQRQYAEVLVRAEAGDAQAVNELGGAAQQYLREMAAYYGQGSSQYGSLFEEIIASGRSMHGSHADGLGSVPFDGYRAELHSGETVLPAPLAQLYRDSAPGNQRDGEILAELQAMRREAQQLREEVRQLRAERGQDASRAAGQRADQLREQQRINRNTRQRVDTV